MRKVIVTGANGFVGTAVCAELVKRGIDVIAVVRRQNEKDISFLLDNACQTVFCDLSEYDLLSEMIPDRDIDAFFHFAWEGSAGISRSDANIQINNIKSSCDAVKTAAVLGCRKFIFASSIMEYEINKFMSTEQTPGCNTIYCSAKVAADYMARALSGELEVDYIRAVISNIYGPGELSPRLINQSIRKMLAGEHCSFSAGEQLYDFIYIDDAAKSFAEIAEKGVTNRTYYIGSTHPRPLKEFLLEMRDCIDPELQIGLGEIPFGGVSLDYTELDIDAVRKDTGFTPELSFSEGIKKTIAWMKENNANVNV